MKAFVKLLWVGVFVCAQSCAKSNDNASGAARFQGVAYSTLGESELTVTESEISGTGMIIFEQPLGGVSEGAHFVITFALEDGGEARLVTFAKNDLTSGLDLRLGRTGAVFDASIMNEGGAADLSSAFSGMDAAQPMSLHVDMHNDETPAHVLIWGGEETGFGEESALYNSEDDGATPGNGEGTYWGIVLENASLTGAATDAPKSEEE